MGTNVSSLSVTLPVYKESRVQSLLHIIPNATMGHPTSPSPFDRPAKRQRRISHKEDENKVESHPQHSWGGAVIEAEVSQALFDSK